MSATSLLFLGLGYCATLALAAPLLGIGRSHDRTVNYLDLKLDLKDCFDGPAGPLTNVLGKRTGETGRSYPCSNGGHRSSGSQSSGDALGGVLGQVVPRGVEHSLDARREDPVSLTARDVEHSLDTCREDPHIETLAKRKEDPDMKLFTKRGVELLLAC